MSDQARYERIEQLRNQLDDIRAQLFTEIRNAFPRKGEPAKRGVLAEVSRRARWSREYIAQIRDGKVTE